MVGCLFAAVVLYALFERQTPRVRRWLRQRLGDMVRFDAAGLLQRAGFSLPVADVETVTVRYSHPLKLMADLRAMGEANALVDRPRRPLSRRVLARMLEIYVERFGLEDGRVPASFEVLTLTGWAPHASQPQPLKPGSARMRLADALGVAEHRLARG